MRTSTRALADFLPTTASYSLLPFKFHALSDDRELLVSEAGAWLIAERGTAASIAERRISPASPVFEDLLAGFFIVLEDREPVLELVAARYRARKHHLESFTALHIIVVTLRCNLTCSYCQVSRQTADKGTYDISVAHLESALDLIFSSPSPELTIEFQGGEPLVAFDLVKHAVIEAKRRNEESKRKLKFVVCTNLTVLDEDILRFCAENGILLSTSLDGPARLHETNRRASDRGSLDWFAGRLALAREVLGADHVAALMTTSREALSQPEAIIDAYVGLGFRRIFLRPLQPYGFADRLRPTWKYSVADFISFYRRALSYILELNEKGVPIVEDYASILLKKLYSPFSSGYVDLQSPTGMITGAAVYNYDGFVYASDESRMIAEEGDLRFRLGHVTDRYEELFASANARAIVETGTIEGVAGCADCGLQSYCGSDLVRNWKETRSLYGHRPTAPFCELQMGLLSFLFQLIDSSPRIERILRRWAVS